MSYKKYLRSNAYTRSNVYTGMILIDVQKVFDTINHETLLQKLKAIRFSKRSYTVV